MHDSEFAMNAHASGNRTSDPRNHQPPRRQRERPAAPPGAGREIQKQPPSPVVIQSSSLSRKQESEFYIYCRDLKAYNGSSNEASTVKFLRNVSGLHCTTTHLIVPSATDFRRTEKLLSAIASGSVWILPVQWLLDSVCAGRTLDERMYDLGRSSSSELFIAQHEIRAKWRQTGGVFGNWKVVVLTHDVALRQKLSAILRSGCATLHIWLMQHIIDAKEKCLNELTHILVDPAIVGDEKFRELNLRGSSSHVEVVSFIYVEEYLTSAVPPEVKKFDVHAHDIIRLHQESKRQLEALPPHDVQFGSPCLSIHPRMVEISLNLTSRLKIPTDNGQEAEEKGCCNSEADLPDIVAESTQEAVKAQKRSLDRNDNITLRHEAFIKAVPVEKLLTRSANESSAMELATGKLRKIGRKSKSLSSTAFPGITPIIPTIPSARPPMVESSSSSSSMPTFDSLIITSCNASGSGSRDLGSLTGHSTVSGEPLPTFDKGSIDALTEWLKVNNGGDARNQINPTEDKGADNVNKGRGRAQLVEKLVDKVMTTAPSATPYESRHANEDDVIIVGESSSYAGQAKSRQKDQNLVGGKSSRPSQPEVISLDSSDESDIVVLD